MAILSHDQLAEMERQLTQCKIEKWLAEDLFSPVWWLMLAVLILPWLIWWKWVDRRRIVVITLYGLLLLITSSYLDAICSELALWQYNKMLLPLWSRLVSVDFAVMPVTYMFLYQYFRPWPVFTAATTAVAVVYAFGAEHLLEISGIYQVNHWSHWYSFILYIIIGLSCRLLTDKIAAQAHPGSRFKR
ncbi:MAG: hypothetical protein P4N59_20160 [Negativicutes bacterium]|nr:hypothetical protein [Negativicutes bacterium]